MLKRLPMLRPKIKVTAGLIWRHGKVLAGQRSEAKYGGLWEFPGGKIEEGESAEECLQRELQEELGIICKVGRLFAETEWEREDKIILLKSFTIDSFVGEPRNNVHLQLKWCDPQSLSDREFLPADRPIIDLLKRP